MNLMRQHIQQRGLKSVFDSSKMSKNPIEEFAKTSGNRFVKCFQRKWNNWFKVVQHESVSIL